MIFGGADGAMEPTRALLQFPSQDSRTWSTSSGDMGLLEDADEFEDRDIFVHEYNALAKKVATWDRWQATLTDNQLERYPCHGNRRFRFIRTGTLHILADPFQFVTCKREKPVSQSHDGTGVGFAKARADRRQRRNSKVNLHHNIAEVLPN